jgi:hypothetical protein
VLECEHDEGSCGVIASTARRSPLDWLDLSCREGARRSGSRSDLRVVRFGSDAPIGWQGAGGTVAWGGGPSLTAGVTAPLIASVGRCAEGRRGDPRRQRPALSRPRRRAVRGEGRVAVRRATTGKGGVEAARAGCAPGTGRSNGIPRGSAGWISCGFRLHPAGLRSTTRFPMLACESCKTQYTGSTPVGAFPRGSCARTRRRAARRRRAGTTARARHA